MKRLFFPLIAVAVAVTAGSAQAQLRFNPNQVALLRWYPANQAASFSLNDSPQGIAFDGANFWISLFGSVTNMRASDGADLGTFEVAFDLASAAVAFDGANIWVTTPSGGDVTKLRATDGGFSWALRCGFLSAGRSFRWRQHLGGQ